MVDLNEIEQAAKAAASARQAWPAVHELAEYGFWLVERQFVAAFTPQVALELVQRLKKAEGHVYNVDV